jgi:hypothetical protein
MTHRYRVGQILEMRASPRTSTRPAGPCEVIFRLPHEGGPVLYRVRSLDENTERVVDEVDLSPSDATAPRPGERASTPFTIAIKRR